MSWQAAYVAVSVLLGERYEDAMASLGAEGAGRAAAGVPGLAARERGVRAAALARVLSAVALEVDALRLA